MKTTIISSQSEQEMSMAEYWAALTIGNSSIASRKTPRAAWRNAVPSS